MKKTKRFGIIKIKFLWICVAVMGVLFSCNSPEGNNSSKTNNKTGAAKNSNAIQRPPFNSDSAYAFIQKQVDFGPRVPGTEAQEKCKNYLVSKFKAYGLKTIVQHATVTTFNNKEVPCYNIIGRFKPKLKKRILILAHWDSRPFADLDTVNQDKPIMAADDGGSGVAVILELARQLQIKQPDVGVDFLLDDVEDYGQPDNSTLPYQENSWCLGTQYFAKHLPIDNFSPQFGILLDMVGASGAVFPKEGISVEYASAIVDKVWGIADQLGYSNYFVNATTPATIDDHTYINRLLAIPTIDIVHYNPQKNNYPYFHHTHQDNMSIIDKNTLQVVGEVVYATILSEAQ